MDSPNEASAELELAVNHHLGPEKHDGPKYSGGFLPKLDDDGLVGPPVEATPGDVVPKIFFPKWS
jgi:hypothetical protein